MFGAICLHWSLKSPNSQRAYAKVLVIKTEFTYSSIALQPIRVNNSRNGIECDMEANMGVAEGVTSPYLKIIT